MHNVTHMYLPNKRSSLSTKQKRTESAESPKRIRKIIYVADIHIDNLVNVKRGRSAVEYRTCSRGSPCSNSSGGHACLRHNWQLQQQRRTSMENIGRITREWDMGKRAGKWKRTRKWIQKYKWKEDKNKIMSIRNITELWYIIPVLVNITKNRKIALLGFRTIVRKDLDLVMKVQGRRKRGRPKRRWLDKVKDDIKEKGLSADDVYDRATWRRMSSYIDPT